MSKLYTKTFTLPNGKRKFIRAKTKEELERKLIEAKLLVNAGVDISTDTTFKDYVDLWFDTYKKNTVSNSTQRCIKTMLRNHVIPVLGPYKMRDIKPMHIQRVMSGMSDLSRVSQHKVLCYMKEIFNSASDNSVILKSPVLSSHKPSGPVATPRQALTKEQEEKLLSLTYGSLIYGFIYLGLNTGMRRGELLGLQWGDVDLEHKVIHVQHNRIAGEKGEFYLSNSLKTPAAKRSIPIPDHVCEYLRSISKTSVYVLTGNSGPLTRAEFSYGWNWLEKLEEKGILPVHVFPHLLRHTYATRMLEAGLDVKEVQHLLGHTTVTMTLQTYTHYCEEMRAKETGNQVRAALSGATQVLQERI